jgi:hypothetical protein
LNCAGPLPAKELRRKQPLVLRTALVIHWGIPEARNKCSLIGSFKNIKNEKRGSVNAGNVHSEHTEEQEDGNRPSVFGYPEREQMFSVPKPLLDRAQTLRAAKSQIRLEAILHN